MTAAAQSRPRRARQQTGTRSAVSRHAADKRFKRVKLDERKYPELKGVEFPDYEGMAIWYCEELLAGRVPCVEYERKAAKRFLDMRKAALDGTAPYTWSSAHVTDACSFIEKLPHVKAFEGTMVLEPVQCWWLAGIFGFRDKSNGLRWVINVNFWVPRKNGKTTLSTGVVFYCLLHENEVGGQAVISAGSEAQAHIPYDAMRAIFEKDTDFKAHYGVYDTKDETTFKNGSEIKVAHARAKNLDGLNPSIVLAEELHAQAQDVIGVLRTAMGSRRAPLWLSISTAGRDTNVPAYDDWQFAEGVLNGTMKADRAFCVIYAGTEDDKDRRFDSRVLERINPMWGVSLNPVTIEEEEREARKSEEKLQEYYRTRLNIWSRAAGNLLSVEDWERCSDRRLNLDLFKGYPLFVGLDLASKSDLNAASFITSLDGCVYSTAKYWLPEHAKRFADDRFADQFIKWREDGYLNATPGKVIDYEKILEEVLAQIEGHNVMGIGLDEYQANYLAKKFEDRGYPVFILPKRAKYVTTSTDDLIARTADPDLFQNDGNPVTKWCAGNVVGHYDANSNVLPKKEKPNSKANIDGIDALIIANAMRIDWEAGTLGDPDKGNTVPMVYMQRGLAGVA